MNISNQLKIRPFRTDDQDPVYDLILSGLEERWGVLDLSKNSDLTDISDYYRDGVFLVGLINQEIVGTGALLPEKESACRIVRMSTKKDCRNQGIGTRILDELISIAKDAETAGWDGFFLWDHIATYDEKGASLPHVDPWQALTAAALQTTSIRLGTTVTPLPRR